MSWDFNVTELHPFPSLYGGLQKVKSLKKNFNNNTFIKFDVSD